MPSLYCWGDRNIPYRVLDRTDDSVLVEIEGAKRTISLDKIKGWAKTGDRIRLRMGSFWSSGTVLDGSMLRVQLDSGGKAREIWKTHEMRSLYVPPEAQVGEIELQNACDFCINSTSTSIPSESVPMPALEDFEADEMAKLARRPSAVAQQYDLLEPLAIGDRVRIVLAGKPLEHLTGLLGTVAEVETFGLVAVVVDEQGEKLLRRSQLDLIEAAETMGIPIVSAAAVRHKKRWPGKSAELRPLVPT
jgi:hypothetical protein